MELLVKSRAAETAVDNRLFVNAVLWILRSGARWQDLPERYGKYKSVHKRFVRWAHSGVWERVFAALVKERDNRYLMLDSTIVKAHQQAATGRKKGSTQPFWLLWQSEKRGFRIFGSTAGGKGAGFSR
ncbi:MAG: IS5 family transposase [Acidobacteriales bacterium]|nr:IS5 family transposase [Terriglobales bacterium]